MNAFFVAGIPQPQGSKTGFVVGGRAVVVDKNPGALKPWRKQVAAIAGKSDLPQLDGPVRVHAVFVLPKPKSVKRDLPHVRPDLDKLARALLDGITDAGVWKDDSQVVELDTSKVYGDAPGVHVVITKVPAVV